MSATRPASDPTRILVLNERDPAHPRAGGAETHVAEIFGRLAARGHAVRWLASGFPGGAPHEQRGGIGIERAGSLPRYYAGLPGRVRRAVASDEARIVVECLNKVPFYSPLYARRPVLALCHHLFGAVAFRQVAWPLAAAVVLAERGIPLAYRRCRFVAISESSRDDLVQRGVGRERIDVSHPGIRPPRRSVDPEASRRCRIAYVGRLEAYKGIDVLLRAAARLTPSHPDLEIVIMGRGSARPGLERLARSLGLARRTRFTGFVDDDERDALLAASRVCALPSEKEGWGLSVIEANALATPVVASDVPGLRDSIRSGVTGLSVPVGDVEGFAGALARLLEEDDEVRAMRRAALEWSRRFGWERAADEMEAAIARSLADAGDAAKDAAGSGGAGARR